MARPSISRRGFITSDADERLPPRQISDMDEGVVEGGEDVRDAEDVLALADGGAERHVLLLGLPRLPPPGHGCVRVLAAAAGAAAGRRREKEKARVRRNSERRGRGEERTEKWVEITPGVNSVQWAHSLEGLLQREWAWFSSMFPACAGRLVGRVLEVLAQHSTLRSISKQRNCLCQKKTKKLSTAFFHPGG